MNTNTNNHPRQSMATSGSAVKARQLVSSTPQVTVFRDLYVQFVYSDLPCESPHAANSGHDLLMLGANSSLTNNYISFLYKNRGLQHRDPREQ